MESWKNRVEEFRRQELRHFSDTYGRWVENDGKQTTYGEIVSRIARETDLFKQIRGLLKQLNKDENDEASALRAMELIRDLRALIEIAFVMWS